MANSSFKQGYCRAIANIIHTSALRNGQGSYSHSQLITEVAIAYKGYGWSWNELVDAGVERQDLVVFEDYRKQLGL